MPEAALVLAAAANHRSWFRAMARATGGEVRTETERFCVRLGRELIFPFPRRMPPFTAPEGVRTAGVWHDGLSRPRALERDLANLGFEEGWQPHWMAGEVRRSPSDPRVQAVTQVPEYDAWGQALLRMPRSVHFAARVDGRLAGHAWLHTWRGTAGIYDVEVWPEFQRQGLGTALTRAALSQAAGRVAVLNATPDGTRLYEAMGFSSLGWGRTWWLHGISPSS